MTCTTRLVREGDTLTVRIPAELAYGQADIELEIERVGDELRLRPVRRRLDTVLDRFAAFSADFMADGRGSQEDGERDGW